MKNFICKLKPPPTPRLRWTRWRLVRRSFNGVGRFMDFFNKYGIYGILSICFILFTGCSKKDTSLVGTGVGAAIGAEAAGKNDKILGAAAGAVAGHWVGSKIGEAIEEDKLQERREKEEVSRLKYENRRLRKAIKKWCPGCREWLKIAGANTCPYCGHSLAVEKYCSRCGRTFNPDSSYRYCSKCFGGIHLKYR